MNHNQNELYQIFSYAFQMLDSTSCSDSKTKIAEEIVKLLDILKTTLVTQAELDDANQDFYRWLALRVFAIILDSSLDSVLIVDAYMDISYLRSSFDPLILTEIIDIFMDAVRRLVDSSETYLRRMEDPIFVAGSSESKTINVQDVDELRPIYRFFVSLVDRCSKAVVRLDQIYTFEILNLLSRTFDYCDEDLKNVVLNVVPRLISSFVPNNSVEWNTLYGCLFLYYSQFYRSHSLNESFFESVKTVISCITSLKVCYSQHLGELMFVLCLELGYNSLEVDQTEWVKLSVKVLSELNLNVTNFDFAIRRFVDPNLPHFLPLIETYVLKSVEACVESTTDLCIIEKSSIVWKLCLSVLDRASNVAYSSSLFVKVVDYASSLMSTGRRLERLLNFKYPQIRFEFFTPRNLRSLTAIPFVFNECLGDFEPSKCQSLALYVKAVVDLFLNLKTSKLDDAHLMEHIFVLFTLPWTGRYSTFFSVSTQLLFLDGISNLIFVSTPEKSSKFIAILVGQIFKKVHDGEVVNKFLSVFILLLFEVPQKFLSEIFSILKSFLMPDKIRHLLFNPHIAQKLLCFLSNRCVVHKGNNGWEIRCGDCDGVQGDFPIFGLEGFVDYVAVRFVESLENEGIPTDGLECFTRYIAHSRRLREPQSVRLFLDCFVESGSKDKVVVNDIVHRLAYSSATANKELVGVIYSTLCSILKKLPVGSSVSKLESILELIKRLLTIPYPNLLSIFKMLNVYLSKHIDPCAIRCLFKIALLSQHSNFTKFCKTYEPELAAFVVDFVLYGVNEGGSIGSSFVDILSVLGFKTDIVASGAPLITCVLTEVVKTCPFSMSSSIVIELSNLFSMDLRTFVDKHYETVFCDIYCLDDSTAIRHLIDLFNFCGMPLETTLYWKYSQLVCKLILNSKRPLKIFRFLIHSKIGVETVDDQLSAVKQHFVGCLTVIESTLPDSPSLSVAKNYISSISTLIKILGSGIVSSIQVKLLTTLRTCLPLYYDVLPKRCLTVWVHYCFSVDVRKIGPYLSTIFVHILPLLDKFPEMVSTLFYYFVVDNGVHFKEQLPQLHFVPCYPTVKMQHVWCVVQSSLLNKGNFVRDLLSTVENIYCDSIEAKIAALERLKHCLDVHSSSLMSALSSDNVDDVHPIFETIVTCLLDNASHKNPEVKALCASNLGELGAVDPLKFGFNDDRRNVSPQKYDLTADDFSVSCVTKIVHCLGKYDDSQIMGVLYSTIQELLRVQFADKSDPDKLVYFSKFTVQDQHILHPLLQSKYIFKGVKMDKQNANPITFGLHTVKTPSEWAALWASQMLIRMPSSFHKTVFSICLPAMFIDLDVTETVLPYILLYALIDSAPCDVDLIEKEMKYILHWDVSKHRTKPDNVMTIVGSSSKSVVHSDVSQTKYIAIILDLLDFVNQAASDRFFFGATLNATDDESVPERISGFMKRFPSRAMSCKSFIQNDYSRSLFYFEKGSSEEGSLNLKPLRNIYSKLNDVDGLVGVTKSSTVAPTAEEMIVNHTVCGALQSAIVGYERLCSKYESTSVYRGLIQCYININQPMTALAVSKHIIKSERYLKPDVFSEHVEAAWNALSREETFDAQFLDSRSWSVDLVDIFRLMTQTNYTLVLDKLKTIRLGIVNSLADLNRSGMNLYRSGYWYMVKLHILNDLESLSQNLFSLSPRGSNFEMEWSRFERRLSLLPSHGPYTQDVRKTHLQSLDVVLSVVSPKLSEVQVQKFNGHLGVMWLHSGKRARKNKNFQGAYTCINIAEKYRPPELFIELAKYYQSKFETEAAVFTLQQGLAQNDPHDRKIRAKAKLLMASFNVSNMNLDFNDGYSAFKEAAEVYNLEKSFVSLASYLYRQHLTEEEPDNTTAKRFIQIDSARNFSKSLLYGTKHIYQSMPCLLSLWLDYGARAAKKSKKANNSGIMLTLKDFNDLMENNLSCLPTKAFVTAFSQILSRINHRESTCFDLLKTIIVRIIRDHHRQALWSFVAVCRSSNTMQRKRSEEICKLVKSSDNDLAAYFKTFNSLVDKLIEISQKKLKYSRNVTLSQICPSLKSVIETSRSSPIMLPLQKFLTVNVCDKTDNTPFPLNPVCVVDVKNQVLMLHSAQMPLRLEFIGSDGETYPLLCKKDDLRLDSRIMEFNSVINGLLQRDASSCEKGLSIRTYSVVPLNSECGVIQWLSGLSSLKGLVTDMYSKLGIDVMPMSQIKKLMMVQKGEVEVAERLRRFVKVILPKHPPVLHKWFFERHPSPDDWYHCRSAFVKSSAVMSIVGYIVGLGDRHGENILIDSKSGEAVHVDFNCMFNRSDLLYYPETVPFRLTHSMVHAMGSTGIEGLFITSCEATNRVMRHHSEQLLSVMKPFLYDLDVKGTTKKLGKDCDVDDQSNDEAKVNIQNVEMRLSGVVRCKNDQWAPHRNTKPLSVEGQTRMLIKEATSELNLCQMFAGWAPYM